MMRYTLAYCLGFTPWERYGMAAAESIGALLDREEAERLRPLGRAIDLGCGRGRYTAELARRGWEAVGIDNVPRAIDAANRSGVSGATFVVGDVTKLAAADPGRFDFFLDVGRFQGLSSGQRLAEGWGCLCACRPGCDTADARVPADPGRFDFFLDVGCFQGLSSGQRLAEGRGVSALADPGATLLMLAFQPTTMRSVAGGVTRADIEAAFPGWEMLSVEPADTAGLGWPLNKTAPRWYRLRLQA